MQAEGKTLIKEAEKWLKKASHAIRNERFSPIREKAMAVFASITSRARRAAFGLASLEDALASGFCASCRKVTPLI